jgi:hypothetical protein
LSNLSTVAPDFKRLAMEEALSPVCGRPDEGESARGERNTQRQPWEQSTHTIKIASASAMDQIKKGPKYVKRREMNAHGILESAVCDSSDGLSSLNPCAIYLLTFLSRALFALCPHRSLSEPPSHGRFSV